jgi:hypothetical protein
LLDTLTPYSSMGISPEQAIQLFAWLRQLIIKIK